MTREVFASRSPIVRSNGERITTYAPSGTSVKPSGWPFAVVRNRMAPPRSSEPPRAPAMAEPTSMEASEPSSIAVLVASTSMKISVLPFRLPSPASLTPLPLLSSNTVAVRSVCLVAATSATPTRESPCTVTALTAPVR